MLRVRWIGEVAYREVLALQTALFEYGKEQHLLLLEHPHVFTYGPRSDLEKNLLCNPAEVGAGQQRALGRPAELHRVRTHAGAAAVAEHP